MRNNFKPTSINFDSIRLLVASPGDILGWSFGEVTKPETINYRTQKPERDGLFCEKIFGPTKDINPHDSKFRGIRARDTAVDRNGNIVTKSSSRRERMGHIKLAVPVVHDWFMRVEPTPISKILGIDKLRLKKIVAYQSYVITDVDNEKVQQILVDNEAEYEAGKAAIKIRYDKAAGDKDVDVQALAEEMSRELTELTDKYENVKKTLGGLYVGALMSENYYRNMDDNFIDIIEVGMGGEAIYKMLEKVNIDELIADLKEEVSSKKGAAVLKAQKRLTVVENIKKAGIEPTSFCLTVLPVIPPALRPMVQLTGGRFATSDINDLYRRVINRNNRLKKFIEKGVPEVILRNEKRILQESVNKLINNTEASSGNVVTNTTRRRSLKSLSEALSGKRGLFRQNLLGKRVDYSGRSVIVIGPELDIDECGLPKEMALELFKPFVIGKLLEWEQANNFHNAARLIEAGEPIVWDALDEAIEGKYVLLNRAPTLHRLGIQAFRPKLIEGKAIQINPLVTTGFNADFDGDQMAVHLPLSDWSQAEARDLMSAKNNLLKPADGAPTLSIYQDIVLGCYYITYEKPDAQIENPKAFTSIDEAIMAYNAGEIKLQTNIIVRYKAGIHTTNLGRLLFNEILPEDFPFVNETMTKKVINRVLAQIFNQYDNNAADESGFITADVADRLKELSLKYATKSSVSTGMDDYFEIDDLDTYVKNAESKEIKINEAFNAGQLTEIEKHNNIRKLWNDTRKEIASEFENVIEDVDTSISVLAESGARGSVANVVDVSGIIGTVDATYNVSSGSKMQAKGFDKMKIESEIELPVKGNYKNGVPPLEMFNIARNDRKGLIDTALNTAKSGYITRKLVDVAQDVFTVEDDPNEIDPGFPIYRVDEQVTTVAFKDCIYGRYLAEDVKGYGKTGELVTGEMADAIQNDESIDMVRIMSPLSTTTADGIPCRSYGIDMTTGRLISPAEPVGVIAAQSVGEPTTQLTLNNKHGAGEEDVVEGLPRLEEILEAYSIENRGRRVAILSEIAGKINIKEDGDNYIIKVTGSVEVDGEKHKEVKEYITANKPIIENGDNVKPGDRLTEGLSHIVDLMRLAGEEATKRYIVNEILRLYAGQGYNLATKHIEVIVSQMFSRVRIIEQGDSEYATGSEISRQIAKKINDKLVAAGKKPMVTETVLMGIKQVSSRSDSFLSAASFQATISELNKAAVRGAVDHLHGLKENVIIGRKIPVGTGVVPEEEFYENEFAGESIDEIPA